jgi:membrane protein YqaA with SNARE-associated domain
VWRFTREADRGAVMMGPSAILRAMYDWTMRLAATKNATAALAFVSFIESSVFPIPPDVLLIPMVLARRAKAWWLALVCTAASVLGGLLGYAIGALLFVAVAEPILSFYGYLEQFDAFADYYNSWGAWAVLIAGVTPFPFKVITIASGATQLSLVVFIVTSLVARAIRFFAVAGLLYWFGPPIRSFIEARLGLMFMLFVLLLIGGFVVARYAV